MLKNIVKWFKSLFTRRSVIEETKLDHSSAIEYMSNMKKAKLNPNLPTYLLAETPEQAANRKFRETIELMKIKNQEEKELVEKENKTKTG